MRRFGNLVATGSAVVGIAVAAASAGPATSGDREMVVTSSRGAAAGYGDKPFAISVSGGSVKGLYPGVTKDMKLLLANPYPFALKVTDLRAVVTTSSRARCRPGPTTVVTRPYNGKLPLVLPARSRKDAGTIPIAMPPDAPQACQKTSFTIKLTGTAKKASR